jgi:2-C-methyl-D-erythritol 2,4-cyclodiphosphate synthase
MNEAMNADIELRVGQGLDVHAFGPGNHVMLGAVRIPHERGLAAHSDGDVVLHALCDALLGAAALGDIGQHFPPGEERWRDADSRDLLARVLELLAALNWRPVNVDLTVACEQPRISAHVPAMREAIAGVLGLATDAVSVKGTTTEKLGFCGRGEGIAALAVVLVRRG